MGGGLANWERRLVTKERTARWERWVDSRRAASLRLLREARSSLEDLEWWEHFWRKLEAAGRARATTT